MSWLVYAVMAASTYGFYNFFLKLSSDKLNPAVANIFIAGTSCLIAIIATIYLKLNGQDLSITKETVKFPIMAGLFAGVAEIFYLTAFSKNIPLSIGNPLIVGGTTLIAVLLGLMILKEPVNLAKIMGIILTLAGLVVLSRS